MRSDEVYDFNNDLKRYKTIDEFHYIITQFYKV